MKGYNKVIIAGNLVHDPELRYTTGGMALLSVAIAVNSQEKDGDGWKDRVDYFDVTLFGNKAEAVAHFLRKGSALLVEGRLRQERWEDAASGKKRSKVGIVASQVVFLGTPKNGQGDKVTGRQGEGVPGPVGQAFPDASPVDDGEIPF